MRRGAARDDERLAREDERPAKPVRRISAAVVVWYLLGDSAERLARLHDVHRRPSATTQ